MTITYQTIIEKVNQIPVVFLQDVYNILHSFSSEIEHRKQNRGNILKLAGSWSDISKEDYKDLMSEINRSKKEMFN